jgi:hypothetical protein
MQPFVLLYHTLSDNPHWDLCLDMGDTLATWRLEADPCRENLATPVPARRIADHRRAYLDYEGPVSGDRGHVRRVDRGTWRPIRRTPTSWQIHLEGEHVKGLFELPATDEAGAMRPLGQADSSW